MQYDGTDFYGSQIQPGKRTVQGVLTEALRELLGEKVRLLFASRTDRGVHATHNVCSFRIKSPLIEPSKLPEILNARLPLDLRVVSGRFVNIGFHPRFLAIRRDYVYRIYLGKRDEIFLIRYAVRISDELDLDTMRFAATLFKGKRDFTPFAVGASETKDPICELYRLNIIKRGRNIFVKLSANRFLRKMACVIVGALVAVGRGEISVCEIKDALQGKKPKRAFPQMPPNGLTLTNVVYPRDALLVSF